MKRQRVSVWIGGQPDASQGCQPLAEALPVLPPPTQLNRAALIEYRWGEQRFQILATACTVRTTSWGSGQVTWLHCKGRQTATTKPDEPAGLLTVLIPAHYVTGIHPGPTFRLVRSQPSEHLGVFPPNQSTPADGLPLAEIEQAVEKLMTSERN